jgi:outer membrane protein TolC
MKLTTVVSALFACAAMAFAAEPAVPATRPISLQECIELALKHNLELRIERYNPQLALYSLHEAQAGYEPVFDFTAQHDDHAISTAGLPGTFTTTKSDTLNSSVSGLTPWGMSYNLHGNAQQVNEKSYTLSNGVFVFPQIGTAVAALDVTQPLLKNLWMDSTRLNIALAKNQVKFTGLTLEAHIIDIVTRVELAYYDLQFGTESVKVQQKGLELAQRLLAENRKRVEVGTLAPLDEKQAEAQVAGREADLLDAQRNREVLENALKRLITDDFSALNSQQLDPSDSLEVDRRLFNLQDSWSRGLTTRPEYLQAKITLENQGIQLKFDKNQIYPQLDLFGTVGYNGAGNNFSDAFDEVGSGDRAFYAVGAHLNIPLGNGLARNRLKSTKAAQEQSAVALKQTEQGIMIDIDNAIKVAESSYERIGATRKASEYALAALDAEQKKLESGKSTSFVVLSLQRDLIAAKSDEINALVQYKRNLAQAAQAEGSTLERRKIDINAK